MVLSDYLPFYREPTKQAAVITQSTDVVDQRAMAKLFKVAALALGYTGVHNFMGARTTFEPAPYDFERILKAVDTDSFVRQGLNKYKELLWKEGWNIVGENDVAVDYAYERIDYMEFAMRRPFQDFLYDVGDQLVKFGNCFSGEEEFLTKEYGPVSFSETVGESVTVLGKDGWTQAEIHAFGEQEVQRITFAAAFPNKHKTGYVRAGRSKYRLNVVATPDHRWILKDGGETTNLSVGDSVEMQYNPTISNHMDYQEGLRQGIVFGDGSFDYKYRNSDLSSYKVRLCGKKREYAYLFSKVNPFKRDDPEGDLCVFHKSSRNLKELPYSGSPDFFRGFLDGWIITDGHMQDNDRVILTGQHPEIKDWTERFAAHAGWIFRGYGVQGRAGDEYRFGDYVGTRNGSCYRVQLSRRSNVAMKVVSIEPLEEPEPVYCAVVPDGAAFTLASGMLTGNCFIAKARGDLGQYFPGSLSPLEGKDPVVGYYVVPAETIEIKRNKKNKILSYRQRIDGVAEGFTNRRQPRWAPEDMIHLAMERKPGRAFGTPFLVSVLDDVIALRQMEEDIQNLVHKELFPLYKYKVGTEDHPAEPEEIDHAARELESLRTDGGLVLPDRHDVEVIGANNSSLDASDYMYHFMLRVCVGLGLSPHHLGILLEGGNRAVTERLDVALYDKIKTYQNYLSGMIRLHMLSEILIEGGFDPITHPMVSGESDRCEFRFNEIDVDTQVKRENHIINKYSQNVINLPETRLALGEDPDVEENYLQAAVMARLQPQQVKSSDGQVKVDVPEKPDAQTPSTGGSPNPKNTRKDTGNKTRPSNQHGRRSSPNIKRGDDDDLWLTEMVELIDEEDEDTIIE